MELGPGISRAGFYVHPKGGAEHVLRIIFSQCAVGVDSRGKTDKQTDTQPASKADKQTIRQRDGNRHRDRKTERDRGTDRQTERKSGDNKAIAEYGNEVCR